MTCQADHLVTDILDEMKMEEHMQSVIQTPQLYVSVPPGLSGFFIHKKRSRDPGFFKNGPHRAPKFVPVIFASLFGFEPISGSIAMCLCRFTPVS